ncbi:hypothetical protein CCMA1212_009942 [Trichoderma ghanense]|uniref:MARVEL domain-containing protein n=1 Tax=Trichoderma ghanense TaxID=65468 RepID=A0ABY2GRU5_9HYPO
MDASERPRGQEHIPEYPKLWIWMRVFQLVVGLAVLFLSIHALEGFRVLMDLSIVMIVISAASVGLTIWLIVAQFSSPRAFRYWITLVLDFLIFVAWTVSGSILVSHTSALVAQRGVSGNRFEPEHEQQQHREGWHPLHESHVSTFYAIAGLACLEFSLFCSSWIIDAVVIRRHRQIGLPSKPLKKRASMAERSQAKPIPVSPPQKPRVKPTLAERVEMLFKGQEASASEGVGIEGSGEGGRGGHGGHNGSGDGVV